MNLTAVSDLKDALHSFLQSVDGEGRDAFSPSPPSGFQRDSPGARAADAAVTASPGGASPHTGQDQGGRRRHLPENVAAAAATAQRLLSELDDLGGRVDPRSPGMRSADVNGGRRSTIAAGIRHGMGLPR